MTAEILEQAIQLRNTAKHLSMWATEPNAKALAVIVTERAERLVADLRLISPAPEVEPVTGT